MKRTLIALGLTAVWISTVATTNTIRIRETYWVYEVSSAEGVWQDTTGVIPVDIGAGQTIWFTMEGDAARDSIVVLPSMAPPSELTPEPKAWTKPAGFIVRPGSAIMMKADAAWGWSRLILFKSSASAMTARMGFRMAEECAQK